MQSAMGGLSLKEVGEDEMLSNWTLYLCSHSVYSMAALEQATAVASNSILLLRDSSDACPFAEAGANEREDVDLASESDLFRDGAETQPRVEKSVPAIPPGTCVISIQRRTNARRLYIQGKRPYRAGVDFMNYAIVGG